MDVLLLRMGGRTQPSLLAPVATLGGPHTHTQPNINQKNGWTFLSRHQSRGSAQEGQEQRGSSRTPARIFLSMPGAKVVNCVPKIQWRS